MASYVLLYVFISQIYIFCSYIYERDEDGVSMLMYAYTSLYSAWSIIQFYCYLFLYFLLSQWVYVLVSVLCVRDFFDLFFEIFCCFSCCSVQDFNATHTHSPSEVKKIKEHCH